MQVPADQQTGLELRLMNDLTFKKPTAGAGGIKNLFYDWDDASLGLRLGGSRDYNINERRYMVMKRAVTAIQCFVGLHFYELLRLGDLVLALVDIAECVSAMC